MADLYDIKSLFHAGLDSIKAEHNANEVSKLGILRAGNTGIVYDDGTIDGPCAAKTWLRWKGVDVKGLEDDGDSGDINGREIMFLAGRSNEDIWTNVLLKNFPHKILREKDIPTKWFTPNGTMVTGSPDIVLCDADDKPVKGLELKMSASLFTAKSAEILSKPKYVHLMQAAHYSWQVGVPFELWYTGYVDWHFLNQFWMTKDIPNPMAAASKNVVFKYHAVSWKKNPDDGEWVKKRATITEEEYMQLPDKQREASAVKLGPFIHGYKVIVDPVTTVISYQDLMIPDAEIHATKASLKGIKEYYDMVSTMKVVPPEPINTKSDGGKETWKPRDYCELKENCCAYKRGENLETWCASLKKSK